MEKGEREEGIETVRGREREVKEGEGEKREREEERWLYGPSLLIITLNVKELNLPIKK